MTIDKPPGRALTETLMSFTPPPTRAPQLAARPVATGIGIPADAELQVEWLDDFAQVRARAGALSRFTGRVGIPGFFFEMERLELLWPFYRECRGELAWLWVQRAGECVALAPLQLERKDWVRGGARCLEPFGKVRGALSQWNTDWLIAPGEDPVQVLSAIRAALVGPFASRWDLLELELLSDLDPVTQAMYAQWSDLPFRFDPAVSTALDLGGDFEAYATKFKSKFRREVEREHRKLVGMWGEPKLDVTTSISEERWAQLKALHSARQSQVRGKGAHREPLFECKRRAPLFRAMMEQGERAGRSRHYWFEIEGRLATFMLGLTLATPGGNVLFLMLTAVDDRYAAVSPTRLLMWELLQREAREHGTQRVEMGVGLNLFKKQFGTEFATMQQVQWTNPTSRTAQVRAQWLRMLRSLRARAAEKAEKAGEKMDGKADGKSGAKAAPNAATADSAEE